MRSREVEPHAGEILWWCVIKWLTLSPCHQRGRVGLQCRRMLTYETHKMAAPDCFKNVLKGLPSSVTLIHQSQDKRKWKKPIHTHSQSHHIHSHHETWAQFRNQLKWTISIKECQSTINAFQRPDLTTVHSPQGGGATTDISSVQSSPIPLPNRVSSWRNVDQFNTGNKGIWWALVDVVYYKVIHEGFPPWFDRNAHCYTSSLGGKSAGQQAQETG